MKYLLLILFMVSPASAQDCGPGGADLVTHGATANAVDAQGRPYVTLRAVGGVTIRRRVQPGYGDGSFTYTTRCDPEEAAELRAELGALLVEEHTTVGAVNHIPEWLLERH